MVPSVNPFRPFIPKPRDVDNRYNIRGHPLILHTILGSNVRL
ncbi:unnamed protein product [Brassica oleracea var. botrytis]